MNMLRTSILALLMLAALSGAAVAQQVDCNRSASYDTNSNGATKLVTGTAGRSIYVCGYSIVSGGTVNVSLVYGTGTNCGTGTTAITPAYNTVVTMALFDNSPFWRGLVAPAAKDLCINASSGVAIQAIVYFSQR